MSVISNMSKPINRTELDITSLKVLEVQLASNICYIILGLIGVVGNVTLFYVIIRNKSLRSTFYMALFHVAFADSLFCIVSLIVGVQRCYLYATNTPQTNSPINCAYLLFLWCLLQNTSPSQSVSVAIDRLLCVSFPTRYNQIDWKLYQLINLCLWLTVIVSMGYASTLYTVAPLVPLCTIGYVYTPEFNTIYSSLGLSMNFAAILCYACLLSVLLYRLRNGKRQGKDVKELKKKLQYRAVLTSFMLLGVYTFVTLSGELLLFLTASLDAATRAKMQPYSIVIMLIGCNLAFVICVVRNSDIRAAILTLLPCRCPKTIPTAVMPFSATSFTVK